MRQTLICVVAVTAALLSACGGDDSNGNGGGGGGSGEFGTGLKLGPVTSSAKVGAGVAPWYVWNADKCAFQKTNDHPAEYKAETRKIEGDAPQIGYMHYGDIDPFGVAKSKSIESDGRGRRHRPQRLQPEVPLATEPQSAADTSVTKQDEGVVQASSSIPRSCPSSSRSSRGGLHPVDADVHLIDDHPGMGNNWADVGDVRRLARRAGQEGGWKPEDTALVQCTDPRRRPEREHHVRRRPEGHDAGGFALPKDNVFTDHLRALADPSPAAENDHGLVHRPPGLQAVGDQRRSTRAVRSR